jgi:hypothetical protein
VPPPTRLGDSGLSATVSLEDPSFRRNAINSQESTGGGALSRVLISTNALGVPSFQQIEVSQRNRMPDFVGVLRYDAAWGSAQLSAAVKELNTSNVIGTGTANVGNIVGLQNNFFAPGVAGPGARVSSEYGWAVQGGVKINMPFIAPGDTLYLQGAYGEGATLYTGYSSYNGSYARSASTINGPGFDPYMADATLNPLTGKIELSTSFTVTAAYLHYWSPEWRSAAFGSYGEMAFARGAREANAAAYAGSTFATGVNTATFVGAPGTRAFALSPVLRDNNQFVAGGSIIWSPVKDLDIGLEGFYTKVALQNGRVVDQFNNGTLTATQVNALTAAQANSLRTVNSADTFQLRARVQRDF